MQRSITPGNVKVLAQSTDYTDADSIADSIRPNRTTYTKHAQATQVSLIIERRGGEMRAIIEDDGQGFDRDAVAQAPDAARKIGLKSVDERARQAGGQLDIEMAVGVGTTVYVCIPLPTVANESGAATDDRST